MRPAQAERRERGDIIKLYKYGKGKRDVNEYIIGYLVDHVTNTLRSPQFATWKGIVRSGFEVCNGIFIINACSKPNILGVIQLTGAWEHLLFSDRGKLR